ncbi:hypothetical protein [Azotobacter chroococcum]|uniref:Uncharacterized protein n=1 Tax=Azotobacter chroococcum TaxID=353 RepID=A0AAP9YBX9_9GAMM|nr:hypothetical protein [Azotobacter chroococcum]QQE88562.1 hypothetical protein GKQ51_20400 [Azotobacter chroococcum]
MQEIFSIEVVTDDRIALWVERDSAVGDHYSEFWYVMIRNELKSQIVDDYLKGGFSHLSFDV